MNGQPPPEPWPEEKPATTEDVAAYEALTEIAEQGAPRHPDVRPLGSRTRLLFRLGIAGLGFSLIAGLMLLVLAISRPGPAPQGPEVAPVMTASATQSPPASDATQATPTSGPTQPTPAATGAASSASDAPATWRFTGKWVDVTITLVPTGDGYGRVGVKGEPRATGSYSWNDSTLTITYRQPVTLLTGNVEDTQGRITCDGQPTDARLRCTIRALAWTSTSTSQSSRWLRFTAAGRPAR